MKNQAKFGILLVILLSSVQGQDDFGGNTGGFEDANSFDNSFEDFDNDVDSTMGNMKLSEDLENTFNNIGDTFNDLGNDMEDAFNDFGGDMGDIFNNLGKDLTDAFNSIDFSGITEQGKEVFGDLLGKAKSFTEDQIEKISDALASGNLEELASLGLTEEQQTAVYSAIKELGTEANSGVGKVVVEMALVVGIMVSVNMFV